MLFLIMNKKQLWTAYGVLCFLLIWGWNIVDGLKFNGDISWSDLFNPFHVTQLIYIISCFLATRWVFQRYYTTKKYAALAVSIIGLIAGFILLRYLLEQIILPRFFGISNYPLNVKFQYYAFDNLYYAIVYIILGILIFLFDNQLIAQKKEATLKQERTNTELAFLRSQVSPHFLFNSLNNIYALSVHHPEKAPDAILTLSDLTRYMLYEKQEKVSIEKEWQYLKSFISLQQLRYVNSLHIQMSAEGNLENQIEPYLLIPFVENAFKHGVVDNENKPVLIQLKSAENYIEFIVENYTATQQKDKDGGIGLENVRRRLALLYPGKHEFYVEDGDVTFKVYLKIYY